MRANRSRVFDNQGRNTDCGRTNGGGRNHLRERRTRGPKPARHRLFARFFAGNLHLHSADTVPSFGVDTGQAATVQLAAGTQTFLEVQSLRSWAGAGGDHFQRDTLYVRAISAYWAEKYFPTLTYLGPR